MISIGLFIETIDIKRNYFNVDAVNGLVTVTDHWVQSVELVFKMSPAEAAYMDEISPIEKEFLPN